MMIADEQINSLQTNNVDQHLQLDPETVPENNGDTSASFMFNDNEKNSFNGLSFATSSLEELVLRPSTLPDEVAGVFTLKKIEKDTVFGPYLGEIVRSKNAGLHKWSFSWEIYSPEDRLLYRIDASDANKSNWMRYVNLSTLANPPNLSAFQHDAKVFYKAMRDISPDEELLVWCSEKYNQDYAPQPKKRKVYKSHKGRLPVMLSKKARKERKKTPSDKNPSKFHCDSCPYSTNVRNLYSNHLLNHVKNKAYVCDLCDASFAYKHVLEFHRTTHLDAYPSDQPSTSNLPFKCLRCTEGFETQDELTAHQCSLNCDVCGATMASLISLNNHKRIHNMQAPEHVCELCGFESTTTRALWKHKNRRHASKVLKCHHCDEICVNKTALRYHLQQHGDFNAFKCDHCDASFVFPVDLEAHKQKHNDPNGYRCPVCAVTFMSQKSLKKHYHSHVSDRRLKCESPEALLEYDDSLKCNVCGEVMASVVALNNHKRSHNRQGDACHICDICGFESTTTRALWLHKNRRHPSEMLKCQRCNVICENKTALRLHTQEHSDISFFKCDQCRSSFVTSADYEAHKKWHAEEPKAYKCPICEAPFESQKDLKTHIRVHVNECRLKCDVCGQTFTKSTELRAHKKTHSEDRPFGCDVCGVSFAQKISLQVHTRMHTGERPYKCPTCDATFAYHNSLYVHKRSHTGEKPYKCTVCDAKFSQGGSLKGHMRTHTGEKPFKCALCGSEFSQRTSLKTHTCVASDFVEKVA